MHRYGIILGLLFALMQSVAVAAEIPEARLALVVGEANYKVAPLATPGNDAGLVAETLREAGFDVTEGADLDGADLRQALHNFVTKAQAAGPNAVIFVYLAGRGMQFAGQNYFVPVDALVQREADVPVVAVRLADYFDKLVAAPARARIFVLDGARILHFATEGAPFASGFGIEAGAPDTVYAFNEAPGAVSLDEPGPYGIYAQALVEMLRQGFAVPQVFAAARLRANEISHGIIVPWDKAQILAPFALFGRAKDALPLKLPDDTKPLAGQPAATAYFQAIEHDSLDAYADFCAAFPKEPLTLRVQSLLAVRREALIWQDAVSAATPQAIWTYMRRYPRGPHVPDARRRLAGLAAPLDPPPRFDPFVFPQELSGPNETELEILDRPVMTFDDPSFPPPPVASGLLPERPVEFEHLLPPVSGKLGFLPVPAPLALPFSRPLLPAVAAAPAVVEPAVPPPAPAMPAKVIGVPPQPQSVITPPPSKPAVAEPTPLPPPRPALAENEAKRGKREKKAERPHDEQKASRHAKHGSEKASEPATSQPKPKKKHGASRHSSLPDD